MPEEGIEFVRREDLLDYEELDRLVRLFVRLGTRKIRITGGEPFVRKDLMTFLKMISNINGLQEWNITTNGTSTAPYIEDLKAMGIHSVNLSLDTLDRDRFSQITRRDRFPLVWNTLESLVQHDIKTKVNMVVMDQHNTMDLSPMAKLTIDRPVEVRFIEEMPFNGGDHVSPGHLWDHQRILQTLESELGPLIKLPVPPNSTAILYKIPGALGTIGIIPAFSRSICGSCNRIRLTPQGVLKTCLYDKGIFNMRDMMREGATDEQLALAIHEAVLLKAVDGFEAERRSQRSFGSFESMTTIGG